MISERFRLVKMGALAIGCVSVGVKAFAWLSALGWNLAAGGGFAIARIAAVGSVALAEHANDPVARQLLADPSGNQNQMIFFVLISLLTLLPVAYYARAVRQRMGRKV